MYIKKLRSDQIERMVDFRKSREYRATLRAVVLKEFQKEKVKLIKEFARHPVTLELEGGIGASNTSNTLDGRGNLFSFIGFESSDKPTAPIYEKLNEIQVTSTIIQKNGTSVSTILYPAPNEIFAVTPMPWAEGRSWAEGIEKGIPNLGRYLFKDSDKSRSGKGVQSQNQVSSATFSPTSYIGTMMNKFEHNIKTLNTLRI